MFDYNIIIASYSYNYDKISHPATIGEDNKFIIY